MLRSGTTTFSDQYFFPEAVAIAARESGIRAHIAFPILETPWSRHGVAGGGRNVSDVWVAGKQLVKERQLQTLNKIGVIQRAQLWRDRITGHSR